MGGQGHIDQSHDYDADNFLILLANVKVKIVFFVNVFFDSEWKQLALKL